jgi:transposase-like protein
MSDRVPKPSRKPGQRYTPEFRTAVVAYYAVCGSPKQTAQHFGTALGNVNRWVSQVRHSVPASPLAGDWKKELTETLPTDSVRAIRASLQDHAENPHKAAATGLRHLEGIGALKGQDATANVAVVFTSMRPDQVVELETFDEGSFPVLPARPIGDDGEADD